MNLKDIVIASIDFLALLLIVICTLIGIIYGHSLNMGAVMVIFYGLAGFLLSAFVCGFWLLASRMNDRLAQLERLLEEVHP